MTKSLLAGLAAIVLGLSSCASLPVQYQKQTGKSTNRHSEEIDYARWCADKGYWEEAVKYLEKAETEAVSDEERKKIRSELAENYFLMAEWEYFIAGGGVSFGNADRYSHSALRAEIYCRNARNYLPDNNSDLVEEIDFTCDRIEDSSSPSLR